MGRLSFPKTDFFSASSRSIFDWGDNDDDPPKSDDNVEEGDISGGRAPTSPPPATSTANVAGRGSGTSKWGGKMRRWASFSAAGTSPNYGSSPNAVISVSFDDTGKCGKDTSLQIQKGPGGLAQTKTNWASNLSDTANYGEGGDNNSSDPIDDGDADSKDSEYGYDYTHNIRRGPIVIDDGRRKERYKFCSPTFVVVVLVQVIIVVGVVVLGITFMGGTDDGGEAIENEAKDKLSIPVVDDLPSFSNTNDMTNTLVDNDTSGSSMIQPLSDQELLVLAEKIVVACDDNNEEEECRSLCRNKACCFNEAGESCIEDSSMYCPAHAGCEALFL